MRVHDLIVFCPIALLAFCCGSIAIAQETKPTPIYLDEPEPEPPPKISKQDTLKELYEDETLRAERGVAYLSDGTAVNHGKYVEYYRDGQKFAEGTYQLGVYVGEWKYWHPNGQLCKIITFKAGRPDGRWEIYRPDGTRESVKQYKDGVRDGKWTKYFEDGEQPKIELTYKDGQLNGERKTYFANGQLRQQVIYKNGLLHGTATNWDEAGKIISEKTFSEGNPTNQAEPSAENAKPGSQSE